MTLIITGYTVGRVYVFELDVDVFSMFYLYPRYASLHNIQVLMRITVSIFQHIDNGKYLVTWLQDDLLR